MLGFNALGQVALGQVPGRFTLVAAVGSFLLTGQSALLNSANSSSGGSFTLTGIAQTMRVSLVPVTGSYTLTGVAIAANGAGSFNLAGAAQTFRIVETNVFSSRTFLSQFGFAALGRVPLGGSSSVILDPSFALNGPYVNLQPTLAAALGGYSTSGTGVSQVWQINGLTGAFTLASPPATLVTTWTGLGRGSYVTAFYGTGLPEQWAGRPDTPGVWTARTNDSGVTVTINAHFMFGALGSLALGQGIYNPQIYSEGWMMRPKTIEIWTPRVNDQAA